MTYTNKRSKEESDSDTGKSGHGCTATLCLQRNFRCQVADVLVEPVVPLSGKMGTSTECVNPVAATWARVRNRYQVDANVHSLKIIIH
jgi:hypothetical protein